MIDKATCRGGYYLGTKNLKEAAMKESEEIAYMGIASVWAILFFCVALAGGFALGMYLGKGELKSPVSGTSYDLAIVAKSGNGINIRYYSFEKYYPNKVDLEKDLTNKKAVFENGTFRILESWEKKN